MKQAVVMGEAMLVASGCLLSLAAPASAQGAIRCSAFLHMRDGTWRSFREADVAGPAGVIHIDNGEVLHPAQNSAKGDIARALDAMCDAE